MSGTPADNPPHSAHLQPESLDLADLAFHIVCAGTSRLVQLLADELVPLGDETLAELATTIDRMQSAVPDLAQWRGDNRSDTAWLLEPSFAEAGVRLDELDDLLDQENVERLRRSFELLKPGSLALRRETAFLVVDALLALLRMVPAGRPSHHTARSIAAGSAVTPAARRLPQASTAVSSNVT